MNSDNEKPKYLKSIVLAQICGCLLVIYGHSYPFVSKVPTFLLQLRNFIYCFHMALFVWCSGFLFVYTKQISKKSFGRFAYDRGKRLLVPYFVFSLLGIIPKVLFSKYLNDTLSFDLISIVRAFIVPRDNIWGHFWFLPMIFFIGLLGYWIEKLISVSKHEKIIGAGIVLFLFALSFIHFDYGEWLGINDIVNFAWIYSLGMISAKHKDVIETISREWLLFIGLISFLLSVIVFVVFYSYLSILTNLTGKLISVLMIISIVCLCKYFERVGVTKDSYIAQTYSLFILSWPLQLVIEIILERILNLQYYIVMPAMFIVGVIMPILIIWVVDKIENKTNLKIISFILGR